ncbi:MAG TPA: alpha-galactosidase, partial [Myxococcota bacterium]|nr:alpha-galactosidase [Myxococcota bacterium]
SGMDGLAAAIRDRGLQPGLWMAPLLVHRSTATYLDHPDWWVLDEAGEELQDGACDCATLDVTHPDAAAWMQAQIRTRVSEGWTYLKLDFLYAGAREGQRQEALNGAEAYARAAELLREAAGEDTWILACGAPMLPSVGFADSWRSGADIAFFVAPNPDRAFLRWQARSTAARAWANGRWWWNDADNLMVGADPSAALAAQVAAGGSFLYGEELSGVDVPDLTAFRGLRSRPEDPLDFVSGIDGSPILERGEPNDRVPTRWQLEDGTVVLLNLSEESVELEGPGGTEWISGSTAAAGSRLLEPGTGEVWR